MIIQSQFFELLKWQQWRTTFDEIFSDEEVLNNSEEEESDDACSVISNEKRNDTQEGDWVYSHPHIYYCTNKNYMRNATLKQQTCRPRITANTNSSLVRLIPGKEKRSIHFKMYENSNFNKNDSNYSMYVCIIIMIVILKSHR
jgi:hypothetical protein